MRILYHISLGMWIMGGYIAVAYDDPIPMWVLLIVMNILNFASRDKK